MRVRTLHIHLMLRFAMCLIPLAAGRVLAATGPTSTLYVMNYGEFGSVVGLDLFQGLSESSYPTGNTVDTCIAVAGGDVRTMGYTDTYSGSRFSLTGSPLSGGPYLNSIANSQLHDGTSDGLNNFSVDYSTGDVLKFDRNWASPTVLFNATGTLPGAGYITMNGSDGSFWLSVWGGSSDRIEHRTNAGVLLSSFNSGLFTAGLALDPADGTLWTSNGANTLYQFSQTGTLLQSPAYALSGQFLGMEFATVPEPSTFVLLGMSAFGLTAYAWRKRKSTQRLDTGIAPPENKTSEEKPIAKFYSVKSFAG